MKVLNNTDTLHIFRILFALYADSFLFNGLYADSLLSKGLYADSLLCKGLYADSVWFKGLYADSLWFNGLYADSLWFKGLYTKCTRVARQLLERPTPRRALYAKCPECVLLCMQSVLITCKASTAGGQARTICCRTWGRWKERSTARYSTGWTRLACVAELGG